MSYDSTEDTNKHIANVRHRILLFVRDLMDRALKHDASKLQEPEKESYDLLTPRLYNVEYGSEQYKQYLREMQPAIDHHWANNDHHPEFHITGIEGMNLMSLVEMVADWKAASERHKTGDFKKSIEFNIDRFHIEPQLAQIIRNTLEYMGW